MSLSLGDSLDKKRIYWSMSFLCSMIVVYVTPYLRIFLHMFAGVGAPAASMALSETSGTLANFNPIYGIGLAMGLIMLFLCLSVRLGRIADG